MRKTGLCKYKKVKLRDVVVGCLSLLLESRLCTDRPSELMNKAFLDIPREHHYEITSIKLHSSLLVIASCYLSKCFMVFFILHN